MAKKKGTGTSTKRKSQGGVNPGKPTRTPPARPQTALDRIGSVRKQR